jgi:hypothetical protein
MTAHTSANPDGTGGVAISVKTLALLLPKGASSKSVNSSIEEAVWIGGNVQTVKSVGRLP